MLDLRSQLSMNEFGVRFHELFQEEKDHINGMIDNFFSEGLDRVDVVRIFTL